MTAPLFSVYITMPDGGTHYVMETRDITRAENKAREQVVNGATTACVIENATDRTVYTTCERCGDKKRRDSSCECALAEAESYYNVQ